MGQEGTAPSPRPDLQPPSTRVRQVPGTRLGRALIFSRAVCAGLIPPDRRVPRSGTLPGATACAQDEVARNPGAHGHLARRRAPWSRAVPGTPRRGCVPTASPRSQLSILRTQGPSAPPHPPPGPCSRATNTTPRHPLPPHCTHPLRAAGVQHPAAGPPAARS